MQSESKAEGSAGAARQVAAALVGGAMKLSDVLPQEPGDLLALEPEELAQPLLQYLAWQEDTQGEPYRGPLLALVGEVRWLREVALGREVTSGR